MDLHLNLVGQADLTGQVERALRLAIAEGRLLPGARLPPTRLLAQQLSVARSTVTEAYERLMAEGLLVAKVGAGTFVADRPQPGPATALHSPAGHEAEAAEPLAHWRGTTIPPSWLAPSGLEFDFRVGVADTTHFPFALWNRLLAQEARSFGKQTTITAQPQGEPALRGAIAQHIAQARGVVCGADDVLVSNGAQQAFELLSRVLIAPGTVVAVEEPGYPLARRCFESFGARVVAVAVDAEGLVVDALPADARLVCVTPSHQFPLGMPMSLARRRTLLDWAAAHGALVIEDDYDSEFRFEDRPLDSLQSLDRHGVVAYVGTFSKTMFMPLRRGFMVAPPRLREALVAALWLGGWQTPALGQAALARFIQGGFLAKHIRRMQGIYNRRRRLILALLQRDFQAWLQPVHSAVGIHLAARLIQPLTQPLDLDALLAAAREQGVVVYPLARFCSGACEAPGLVFGYGGIDEPHITEGLARLKSVLDTQANGDRRIPVLRRAARSPPAPAS